MRKRKTTLINHPRVFIEERHEIRLEDYLNATIAVDFNEEVIKVYNKNMKLIEMIYEEDINYYTEQFENEDIEKEELTEMIYEVKENKEKAITSLKKVCEYEFEGEFDTYTKCHNKKK